MEMLRPWTNPAKREVLMPHHNLPISFDPERPDFAPYGLTCVHWRPAAMRRPDHHNEIELNFIESGSVTYLLGEQKTNLEAGRLTAFWAAIPHQIIDFGRNTAYYVATIPLPWFRQWRLPAHFPQGLMQGLVMMDPSAGKLALDRERFAEWERDWRPRMKHWPRPFSSRCRQGS